MRFWLGNCLAKHNYPLEHSLLLTNKYRLCHLNIVIIDKVIMLLP